MIIGDTVIVTAADESFVTLVDGLFASLQDAARTTGGNTIPVYLLDVGLGDAGRRALSSASTIINPEATGDPSIPRAASPRLRAMWAKSQLPRLVPGFATYVWIDADAWVQRWSAIEMLLEGASLTGVAVAPEIAAGYSVLYQKASRHFAATLRGYADAYGRGVARDLIHRPVFNSGVWAARADSPLWDYWGKQMSIAMSRLGEGANDQTAFNRAIYHDQVPIHPLACSCNWVCCHALPCWNPHLRELAEPSIPFNPIGIIHLTRCCCHAVLPVMARGGGVRRMKLDYLSVTEERASTIAVLESSTAHAAKRNCPEGAGCANVIHRPTEAGAAADVTYGVLVSVPICGLCNRLRAFASTSRIARLTGRRLRLLWQPDPDCGARFGDLFENTVDEVTPDELAAIRIDRSYRDVFDEDAERYCCVQNRIARSGDGTNLLIRTCGYAAFEDEPVSNVDGCQPAWFSHEMRAWYRSLVPVTRVRDQVDAMKERFDQRTVGVHIRRTDHDTASSRSTDERFFRLMDESVLREPRTRFFLATDCRLTEDTFTDRYRERLLIHEKASWAKTDGTMRADRTAVRAMQDALVDLILLSSTYRVLGSQGSTFSRMAGDMSVTAEEVIMA